MTGQLFVALPEDPYTDVFLTDPATGKNERQVLWGDFLRLAPGESANGTSEKVKVQWGGGGTILEIERRHVTPQRPLEIIFVDVGQGDGSVLITPERDSDERIMVVDAGEGEEMLDFLRERFKLDRLRDAGTPFPFHAAVITHPDLDHYWGFEAILAHGGARFETVYHSGLVEHPHKSGWDQYGTTRKRGGKAYIEGLVPDDAGMRALFGDIGGSSRKFARTINAGIAGGTAGRFEMLGTSIESVEAGLVDYVPGFDPNDRNGYRIEILGPVIESGPGGEMWVRRFSSKGKMKNGHSVLLRLCYDRFSIFFGGDLNKEAEQYLLTAYAGMRDWPVEAFDKDRMLALAQPRFRSDVMKVCHHGSSDVTDEFLAAVDPAAFVISSGDEEGHVHPRPDLLGRLGKIGRGRSPVILSTELQRSTRAEEDQRLIKRLMTALGQDGTARSPEAADKLAADLKTLGRSNVEVDGAIYLKTDGQRLIAAFKKETSSKTKKWFWFEFILYGETLMVVPR
ncbi:ComEC/Rec2 family competence protein [Sphingomicrobium arenosum]|uniref:ComEC/Rec2 family competence protein n=1 Tax=Sphingomicrobium arenosum TaxID=2233861 RepID=UPI00223FE183|nr:MBL fold metallo-hydrolase [Sphingomicrobium arenosum]